MNDIEDIYPLSPTQEGMLYHDVTAPERALYLEQTAFRVLGDLDPAALTAAWQEATVRHAVLRTAFVRERISVPHQVVLPTATVPVRFHDLSGLDAAEQEKRTAEELERQRREPFDLTRPPLMRLVVLRLTGEHLVIWTYHHLILDGWSASLLLGEVGAALAGVRVERPAPPSFKDHITWLRDRDPAPDREFWTAYLAGLDGPADLTLPGMRPGASSSGRFHTVRADLGASTVSGLRSLAARRGTTVSSVVEAAWAGTLSRYSGRRDVIFGVTVSGRPPSMQRADEAVGMYIGTIPVRAVIEPGAPGDEWLAGYAARRHPVLDHQHAPLTDIQRWAGTAPGTSLFDTVVVFENYPDQSSAGLPDGAGRIAGVQYETRTNYAVTLVVRVTGGLQVQAVVDAGRIDEAEAAGLLAHVTAVLERLADDPTRPVRELLAVPARPPGAGIRSPGVHGPVTPLGPGLPDLIDAAVAATPGHPAVVDRENTYTYEELDQRADALARALRARGAGPGERVAVGLGRSADLVTALLAIARTGAAFVPLDPAHPAEHTAYILSDSAPVVLLTRAGAVAAPADWPGSVLDLAQDDPGSTARTERAGRSSGDLAYVIYTSGSTGRPKGVAVGHRALANLVDSLAHRTPGLTAQDRFLALTTLTFDTALAELLVPLAVGATVHVGRQSLGISGGELDRYVVEHGITAVQATPSRCRALLESGWTGAGRPRIYSCGEAFPPDLAAPLAARGSSVWNMYGPTEATVYVSVEEIHGDTDRVSVGTPISNTSLYVLDPDDQEVPAGCVGELCIGGVNVADGYWNRPGLTAERFGPDPFAPAGGAGPARLYRTGDHARFWADGRLEILGRIDRQLKLRGYRIEPGEIEAVLLRRPDVTDAAVAVREGKLVAWTVAADPDRAPGPVVLREYLRERLPSYLIPETFVGPAALPLTTAGKTDVRRLVVPEDGEDGENEQNGRQAENSPVASAPGGGTAERLTEIFREVLARPDVGPDDDFFEMGGDSLRAIRLMGRLEAVLGITLEVESIFDAPSARALAATLDADLEGTRADHDDH